MIEMSSSLGLRVQNDKEAAPLAVCHYYQFKNKDYPTQLWTISTRCFSYTERRHPLQ